jgi:hypothetical protein
MDKEPLIRLTWRGHETVAAIHRLVNEAETIEVALPADYNHALFRVLNPQASSADLEDLDTDAGPELLTDIARVRGLEDLAALASVLHDAQASVRIVTPPTLVISLPR